MIGIDPGLIMTVEAPLWGMTDSGLGKEGGRQGREDNLHTDYVCLDGI